LKKTSGSSNSVLPFSRKTEPISTTDKHVSTFSLAKFQKKTYTHTRAHTKNVLYYETTRVTEKKACALENMRKMAITEQILEAQT
jgi:hypothetical protein